MRIDINDMIISQNNIVIDLSKNGIIHRQSTIPVDVDNCLLVDTTNNFLKIDAGTDLLSLS